MSMKQPTHPGEIIKSIIDDLGLTIVDTAKKLGVTRQALTNVTTQKAAISPEMALRLEAVFGSTAEMWLRMQDAWDLAKLRTHKPEITEGLERLEVA